MHIKFLARGTGSARAAADYLLGERDATGKPRDGEENIVARTALAWAREQRHSDPDQPWLLWPFSLK